MRGNKKNGRRRRHARVESRIELRTRARVGSGWGTEGSRVAGRGKEDSDR